MRQCAHGARRPDGRPGRDLPADDPGAADRDARLRKDRCTARGGLWRLQRRRPRGPAGRRRGRRLITADGGWRNGKVIDLKSTADVAVASAPTIRAVLVVRRTATEVAMQDGRDHWWDDLVESQSDGYVDGKGDFLGNPHPDTLVYVTADHECSGAAIIGASTKTDAALQAAVATLGDSRELTAAATLGQPLLRNSVVGNYAAAGFPKYAIAADGYPTVWDPDFKLLVGYGAGGDRYENFRTRPYPTNDTQQPGDTAAPLNLYPRNNISDNVATTPNRPIQQADGYFVTGQVPGDQAVHTGGDIPLTAYGRGAGELGGTMDNTDVFFAVMKAVVGGTTK